MRFASWLVRAILLVWLSGGSAQAQSTAADEIRLDVLECAGVSAASVRELVALEVAPRRLLAVGSAEPAATRAELSCQDGSAQVFVEDNKLAAPLRLEIALGDLKTQGRARLLALAVAELIATSRLQRSQLPAADAASPDAQPRSSPPVTTTTTPSGAQLWLGLGAARSAQPSMIGPVAAGGLLLYWNALALGADLRIDHAQTTRSVAQLQLNAGSLALAPALRLQASSAELSIGAGVRAGYASLRANPRETGLSGLSVHGFWLAPCAQLALQLRIATRWALRFGAELAYITRTLRGVDTNGEPLLQLRNLALAAQLGVSWDAVASD